MKRGKKKLPHELFYLSYFGLKNCAIRCRIKFCTRKSNSFFSKLGAWYLEKQPNLKKWSEASIAAKLGSAGTKLFVLKHAPQL